MSPTFNLVLDARKQPSRPTLEEKEEKQLILLIEGALKETQHSLLFKSPFEETKYNPLFRKSFEEIRHNPLFEPTFEEKIDNFLFKSTFEETIYSKYQKKMLWFLSYKQKILWFLSEFSKSILKTNFFIVTTKNTERLTLTKNVKHFLFQNLKHFLFQNLKHFLSGSVFLFASKCMFLYDIIKIQLIKVFLNTIRSFIFYWDGFIIYNNKLHYLKNTQNIRITLRALQVSIIEVSLFGSMLRSSLLIFPYKLKAISMYRTAYLPNSNLLKSKTFACNGRGDREEIVSRVRFSTFVNTEGNIQNFAPVEQFNHYTILPKSGFTLETLSHSGLTLKPPTPNKLFAFYNLDKLFTFKNIEDNIVSTQLSKLGFTLERPTPNKLFALYQEYAQTASSSIVEMPDNFCIFSNKNLTKIIFLSQVFVGPLREPLSFLAEKIQKDEANHGFPLENNYIPSGDYVLYNNKKYHKSRSPSTLKSKRFAYHSIGYFDFVPVERFNIFTQYNLERRTKIKKFICAAKRDTKNINILSNSDDQKQVTNQGLYNKKAYNKSRASNQKGSKGLACSALPNQKNTNQSIDNRNSQIAYTKNGHNNNSLVEPIFDKTSDRTLVPMDFSPTFEESNIKSSSDYKFSNLEDKTSVELPILEHDPNKELLPTQIDRYMTLSRQIFLVHWSLAHIRIVYGNFIGTIDLYEYYCSDLYYEESKFSKEKFYKEIYQIFCLLKIHTTKSRENNIRGFTGIKYVSRERDNISQIMEKLFTG